MDNFDFKKYLTEGRIHRSEDTVSEKKQGYNDKLDDSEGAKHGKKKQDMKQRRADSENMEKAKGKRKYSGDKSMDETVINEVEDLELKSLAKKIIPIIKKYKMGFEYITSDNEFESKPKDGTLSVPAKLLIKDGILLIAVYWLSLADSLREVEMSGPVVSDEKKENAKTQAGKMYKDLMGVIGDEFEFSNNGENDYGYYILKVRKKEVKEGYGKKYEEDDIKKEEMSSKMKKSDLKAKIKETILAELSLQEAGFEADDAGAQFHDSLYTEDEEVDVDVDVEDEVNIDAEGDDIEIERPAVKAKVQVGLSPEEEIVQDSLKAAMDAADALGNDKLADQIGNTITFFTREYVVGRNSD